MNKTRYTSRRPGSPKRFGGIILLSALLIFLVAAPAYSWPLIKVAAPSDLTISNVTANSFTLNWTDNSYNEDGFQIEISTGDSEFEYFAKAPIDTTSYLCSGLNQDAHYRVRVLALGNAQILMDSDYSNTASAKTLSIPKTQTYLNAPGDLVAVGTSKTSIKLSWKDNNLNENGFGIERKTDDGVFVLITQVPANYVSYFDASASQGFVYTYRVVAKGDGISTLDSGFSNEAIATTRSIASSILRAPGNLAALAVSSTQIDLTWTDNAINESGYSIERAAPNGNFEIVTTLPVNTTTYTDQGLQDNTKYTYRIRALGVSGNSPYSNLSAATTGKESAAAVVLKFYIENNEYYINDQLKTMDATPIIMDGRTLLPVAYVAGPLGISVYWNEQERKVTLSQKATVIELWIDQSLARINGVDTYIDPGNLNVAPRVLDNRTMLPLSFVVSNLNCKIEWFTSMQEVRVTYPVPKDSSIQL